MKTHAYEVVLLAVMVSLCAGAKVYVNGATGDDTWDGLCETWDGGTCGPKATIQAGIDAATDGDEVVISDGIYTGTGNKNLDFDGKAIAVRSESGPEGCIIDCEADGRGFIFQSGEGPDAIVEGLTITNGSAVRGGGVYCWNNSSPTITNCTISGNSADNNGGGVRCYYYSSPSLTNCTIMGNLADHGGGVYCYYHSNPTVTGCTISGNSADNSGGGVVCWYCSPTLINCTISENSAYYGAGVYCWDSSPTITNCTISGNSADDHGGGVFCNDSSPTLTNCTICGNSAGADGGGISCIYYSNPMFSNCILWGDTPQEIYVGSGTPVVTYSDVQGDWTGEGNIDADPLFVDPDGPDDDPETWEDNDCRLAASSPCIDAADSGAVPADTLDLDGDGDVDEPIPFDLDGRPRFVDDPETYDTGVGTPPIVDMGAYEYQGFAVGDLNCDGAVDFFDIDPFVMALVFPEEYETSYPDCSLLNADCNGDGVVDFFDLDPFVALVTGG